MPPKVDKNKYKFRKQENQTLVRYPGEIDGDDFAIMKCKNCEIYLYDYFEQVFIDDSEDCKVFVGPTRGSIFMRDCKNIKLYSASQQLRISDSTNITACVYSGSDPALENVTGLKMAPFNFIFPNVSTLFEKAGLDPKKDYWSQVFDFTSRKTVDNQPNWKLLDPSEYEGPIIKEIEGFEGDMTNPVSIPQEYGGDSTDPIIIGSQDPGSQQDTAGMMSFSIQTSQQQAQEQVEIVQDQNEQVEQNQQEEQNQEEEYVQQEEQNVQQNEQQEQQENQNQDNNNFSNNNNDNDDDDWYNNTNDIQQQQQDYQQYQSQQFNQQGDYQWEGDNQNNDNNNLPDTNLNQEQQDRKTNKQKQEEIIRQRVNQIQEQERKTKAEKQQAAREWLNNWESQRQQNIAKQAQFLRENNQIEIENRQKESQNQAQWKKISSNIPLKQSDYPGTKDVTVMKSAILNKKKDEENNTFA